MGYDRISFEVVAATGIVCYILFALVLIVNVETQIRGTDASDPYRGANGRASGLMTPPSLFIYS